MNRAHVMLVSSRGPTVVAGCLALVLASFHAVAAAEPDAFESPEFEQLQRIDSEAIDGTVDEILSESRYRHLRRPETELPGWLDRLLDRLSRRRRTSSGSSESLLTIGKIFLYFALAMLIAGLAYLVVRVLTYVSEDEEADPFLGLLEDEAIAPSLPPGELPVSEYERRALGAAESGDFKSALRELILGSMSWIEREGRLRYRRGRTNRDYVRAVWRDVPRRNAMLTLVDSFDRVFYGHRDATAQTFESCLVAFQASFRETEDTGPGSSPLTSASTAEEDSHVATTS